VREMEQREVQGISYCLVRKRGMRNLHLKFDNQGQVVVSAPYFVKLSEIEGFVVKCRSMIERVESNVPKHTYDTGDIILLLGKPRSLEVVETQQIKKTMAQYDIEDEKIVVYVANKDIGIVKTAIKQIYVDTVAKVLESRVPYWVKETQAGEVPVFGVNRAKSKWGVCYPRERRLYLSYMCAILPYELIDMTVLHEVCHLKERGHGPSFWALMRAHMPDLDKRKAQLREVSKMGLTYNLV
jgi:predicted metal-dependent hydrolase